MFLNDLYNNNKLFENISPIDLAEILFNGLQQKYPEAITRYGHEVVGDAIIDYAEEADDIHSMSDVDMAVDEIVNNLENYRGDRTNDLEPDSSAPVTENLRKWFKEKWVRFGPDGEIRGSCARGDSSEGKPKCLPQAKAHALGKKGRKYAAAKKRREDPNPERSGAAINVATKKKSNEGVAEANPNQQISRYNPNGATYKGAKNKMPTLDPQDPVHNADRYDTKYDEPYDPNDKYDQAELQRVMAKQMSTLTDTEKTVIDMRFYDDMSLADVARKLGVSNERIRQIEAKALRKLKHPSRSDALQSFLTQGVAEGVAIVKQDYDLDQMVYVLDVDGNKVSFTYWDYEDDFNNPDIKDIYQQAQEQLGKKLSPEQVKAVARSVFKSFEQGVAEGSIYSPGATQYSGKPDTYTFSKVQQNHYDTLSSILARNGMKFTHIDAMTYPARRSYLAPNRNDPKPFFLTSFIVKSPALEWIKYEGGTAGGGQNLVTINGKKMKLTEFLSLPPKQQDALLQAKPTVAVDTAPIWKVNFQWNTQVGQPIHSSTKTKADSKEEAIAKTIKKFKRRGIIISVTSAEPVESPMTENANSLSIQQLAAVSDAALDQAYGYGRSTPGNNFGWQANLQSAAYAKKMIDAGVTDIEAIADAIHKGWNTTALRFVQDPDQFDDTEKLRQAGKLEAKLQQRAKLMKISYSELDNDEQEKDRVVARALLQAVTGQQGVAEGFNADAYDEEHYYRGHTKDKNGEFQPGPKFDSLGAAQKWRKETPGEHKVTLHRRQQDVAEAQQTCPECGGPAFSNLILAEKQDACYHKVKSRYKVWPSAYASGALVQCRKKGAANWGNKKKTNEAKASPSQDYQKMMNFVQGQRLSGVPPEQQVAVALFKELEKTKAYNKELKSELQAAGERADIGAEQGEITSKELTKHRGELEKEKVKQQASKAQLQTLAQQLDQLKATPDIDPEATATLERQIADLEQRMQNKQGTGVSADKIAELEKAIAAVQQGETVDAKAIEKLEQQFKDAEAAAKTAQARVGQVKDYTAQIEKLNAEIDNLNSALANSVKPKLDQLDQENEHVYQELEQHDSLINQVVNAVTAPNPNAQNIATMAPQMLRQNPQQAVQAQQAPQGVVETRFYFTPKATDTASLRNDFKMTQDSQGWYITESQGPAAVLEAQRAFGIPKIKEVKLKEVRISDFTGRASTIGDENATSPIGSLPRKGRKYA